MKHKKFKIGITAELIALIVVSIILVALVTCYVGYQVYKRSSLYYLETVLESNCISAGNVVEGDYLDEYLETKGTSKRSKEALDKLQSICDVSEFNYFYIIVPDFENNKVINNLSVRNSNFSDLDLYEVGHITEITEDDYYKSYKRIMDGQSELEIVYRIDLPPEQMNRAHVTGLRPILNSGGEVVGIMCGELTYTMVMSYLNEYLTSFVKWLVVIALVIIILASLLLRFRVVIPFIKITKETERFAVSNTLPQKELAFIVSRRNELGQLAASIDSMEKQTIENIENIKKMTAEQERLGAELDIATQIQTSALPHDFPAFPERSEFDLYATMDPAKEVGGDFYDFFLIDEDHLALVIADVSGKGVPAALFMMQSKILIENFSSISMDPAWVLEKANNKLCENNATGMFVTVWLGVLEISTGKLITANGGHEDPVIMRAGGEFELVNEEHNLLLGGIEDVSYEAQEYTLMPGDTVFVYTDGVPEATNSNEELYDFERMVTALNATRTEKDLEALTVNLRRSVDEFVGDAPQFDDLTVLVFRYNGK